MLVDEITQEVVHPRIRDFHGHGGHVLDRTQDREVEGLARIDLDDVHVAYLAVRVAREELRFLFNRRDCRAQPDPDEVVARLFAEALEADREEGASLRGTDFVDFVEDHPFDVREMFPELRGAEDDRDALGRRDEDMRRLSDLPLPLLGGRIAGSDPHSNQRLGLPPFPREFRELVERLLEVAVNIVREGFQRGDVKAVDSVLELAAELLRIELVDDRQERGEGLAAPRGGRHEYAFPGVDQRDGVRLRLRESLELRLEPPPDEGRHEA